MVNKVRNQFNTMLKQKLGEIEEEKDEFLNELQTVFELGDGEEEKEGCLVPV